MVSGAAGGKSVWSGLGVSVLAAADSNACEAAAADRCFGFACSFAGGWGMSSTLTLCSAEGADNAGNRTTSSNASIRWRPTDVGTPHPVSPVSLLANCRMAPMMTDSLM